MVHETLDISAGTNDIRSDWGVEQLLLRSWRRGSSYRGALDMGMVTHCGRDVHPRDRTLGSLPLTVKFITSDLHIAKEVQDICHLFAL